MFDVGSPLFVGILTGVLAELVMLFGEYSVYIDKLSDQPQKRPYRPLPPDIPFSFAFVLTISVISGSIGYPLVAVGYGLIHCSVSIFRVMLSG